MEKHPHYSLACWAAAAAAAAAAALLLLLLVTAFTTANIAGMSIYRGTG